MTDRQHQPPNTSLYCVGFYGRREAGPHVFEAAPLTPFRVSGMATWGARPEPNHRTWLKSISVAGQQQLLVEMPAFVFDAAESWAGFASQCQSWTLDPDPDGARYFQDWIRRPPVVSSGRCGEISFLTCPIGQSVEVHSTGALEALVLWGRAVLPSLRLVRRGAA